MRSAAPHPTPTSMWRVFLLKEAVSRKALMIFLHSGGSHSLVSSYKSTKRVFLTKVMRCFWKLWKTDFFRAEGDC